MITQETKDMTETERLAVRNTNFAYMAELTEKLLLAAHPIGSYYWSASDTDPSELFGGTWEKVEGRFIIGSGTVTDENTQGIYTFITGETGGEYTHKLTVSEMPSHEHTYTSINTIQHVQSSTVVNNYGYIGNGSSSSKSTSATGGNGYHNNLPPFEVANCWKRIA